jgi:hypothetical protein
MNKLKIIIIAIACIFLLGGCENVHTYPEAQNEQESMFIIVEKRYNPGYYIVYHKDTKVMYAISNGEYNVGTFTVLVNPDGTPMVYEEEE